LGLNTRGTIVAGVRPPSGKAVSLSPRLSSLRKRGRATRICFFINWVVRDCSFQTKKNRIDQKP